MLYTMKQKIRVICFVKKNIFLDASGIHASFSFRRKYCTCLRARVHLHRPNQKETAVFRLQQMTFETVQRENSTPWLHHFLHHKSTPESVGLLARCKKKKPTTTKYQLQEWMMESCNCKVVGFNFLFSLWTEKFRSVDHSKTTSLASLSHDSNCFQHFTK